jgi:uncharacterized protein (UPF0332 family)
MISDDYLNNLINNGLLKREGAGFDQIKALLSGSAKNLSAAEKILAIDEETCYAMAYTAMLKAARALLFLNGLRPEDGQQYKTTVDVAGRILGNDFNQLVSKFNNMRRKRNQFTYESLVSSSKNETVAALETAKEFLAKIRIFLQENNPQKQLF